MKKLRIIAFLLLAISFISVSCSKDDPGAPEVPVGPVNTAPSTPPPSTGG